MDTLLAIHSFMRWIIMAVAAVTIIKFAVSWAANSLFKALDRGLASAFSGLMDLQVLLGLIYLIWNGLTITGFPTVRILHAVTMIIAAAVAHLPSRFRTLNDKLRFQYSLIALIGSLILVFIGISILPHGWG
ncbi:MAG TPA: hypothetical protein VLZ89_01445 [Anaerolineales bacterium]|nr:hypothetical protein [Anaerolineales bacterium]